MPYSALTSDSRKGVKTDYLGAVDIFGRLVLTIFAITQSTHALLGWKTPYILATFVLGIVVPYRDVVCRTECCLGSAFACITLLAEINDTSTHCPPASLRYLGYLLRQRLTLLPNRLVSFATSCQLDNSDHLGQDTQSCQLADN